MRIRTCTVSGYVERMSLNEKNKTLTMKYDADTQILIGSNGSGKSSLMQLLQLFIPKGSDFEPGGFVNYEIEHNAKQYYLSHSYKTVAGTYSFKELIDEEWVELNDARKVSAQRELISRVFGMTPEVQALVSGKDSFTEMSPAKRRQWLVSMCQNNYDYAIAVFTRIKDAHRDTQGFLNRSKEHLTQQLAARLSEAAVDELVAKQQSLQNDIVVLLTHTTPVRHPLHGLVTKIKELLTEMDSVSTAKYAEPNTPKKRYDKESLNEAIILLEKAILRNSVRSQEVFQEWQDLSNRLREVTAIGTENASDLKAEQLRLTEQIDKAKGCLQYTLTSADAVAAYKLFMDVKQGLLEAIYALPGNVNGQYSGAKLETIRTRKQVAQQKARDLNNDIANLKAELRTESAIMRDHFTTCPNCDHGYIHGFNPVEHESKKVKLVSLQEQYALVQIDIEGYTASEVEFISYRDKFFAVKEQTSKLSSIVGLDALIYNAKDFAEYPNTAVVTLSKIEDDLGLLSQCQSAGIRLAEVNASLLILGKLSENDLSHHRNRLEQYAAELEKLTTNLNCDRTMLDELTLFRSRVDSLATGAQTVQGLSDKLEVMYNHYLTELYNEAVDSMRATATSELALIDSQLLKNKMSLSGIAMLEKEIAKSAEDERVYRAVLEELSPTTGLIAEGMVGFINDFITAMNTLIKRVWSYPLELQQIKVAENSIDLDYYFPFNVGDDAVNKNDVSEGSSGMLEIFNLTFVITSLRCLKLMDLPLYLDEFGSKFDKAHRFNSSHAIKTIMEELPFTQLFMISHYQSSYGAFANSQTTVLCDKNIE